MLGFLTTIGLAFPRGSKQYRQQELICTVILLNVLASSMVSVDHAQESYNISNEFFDTLLDDSISVKKYKGSSLTVFFDDNYISDKSINLLKRELGIGKYNKDHYYCHLLFGISS